MSKSRGLRYALGTEFLAALDDIRAKVIEEGWFGRAQTLHGLSAEDAKLYREAEFNRWEGVDPAGMQSRERAEAKLSAEQSDARLAEPEAYRIGREDLYGPDANREAGHHARLEGLMIEGSSVKKDEPGLEIE